MELINQEVLTTEDSSYHFLRQSHRHLNSALAQIPSEERQIQTYQLNLSYKSPSQASILNKLTSIQKNRIALEYVKYRKEIEDEQRGGGVRSLEYEFFLQQFMEEAKKKGLYEKVRTIKAVKENNDYNNQNHTEILEMETKDRLQKFLRKKKIERRNLSLTPYQDKEFAPVSSPFINAMHNKSSSSLINLDPMITIREYPKLEERNKQSQGFSQAYHHNLQCEDITGKCDSALQERSKTIYQTLKAHYSSNNWNT